MSRFQDVFVKMHGRLLSSVVFFVFAFTSANTFGEVANPDKVAQDLLLPNPNPPAVVAISYLADLENTPFTDGDGYQDDMPEGSNFSVPDAWNYYRFCAFEGDTVTIETHRTTSAADPTQQICEGTAADTTGIAANSSCGPVMNFIDFADDNNGIPHGVGGSFADPQSIFVAPSTGEYTLGVFDFLGASSGDVTVPVEIHLDGVTPCDELIIPGDKVAQFPVLIDFTDNNPAGLLATIDCNTGSPLMQNALVSEDNPLEGFSVFAVENMLDTADAQCVVTLAEDTGYAYVYTADEGRVSTENCIFTRGSADGDLVFIDDEGRNVNYCRIVATPIDAEVEITKEWEVDGNIDLTLEFDAEITVRSNVYFTNANSYYCGPGPSCYKRKVTFDKGPGSESKSLYFDVGYLGGWVTLDEEVFDSAFESEDDCGGRLSVSPGSYGECTFTNTAFFEGIPTLSQYGMAIMALLMLGMGFVGFRRFV